MDPFMARMLERSRAQLSNLPNNIAENARLREKQLLEAYFAGLHTETENAAVGNLKPGAATMQPVFKVPTVNNLGCTKSIGKENKSPSKEIRKPNIAVVAPNTTELYPRRPPRCVYNSPLILGTVDGTALIFENRYKPKMKNSVSRVPSKEPECTVKEVEERKNPYPSLPKINTSYDLDRLANKMMAKEEQSKKEGDVSSPKKVNSPPKNVEDVNICSGGVKKMVEKFSQNCLVSPPKNSPVRAPPKFDKFSRSPLASSTVNSPVKVVIPKLYHILEPSKPEFRDRQEAPPRAETPKVFPAESKPVLPAYETIEERPLSMSSYNVDNFLKDALGSELFFQSISSIYSEPVFTEDSNMSMTSADSAPVADTSRSSDPIGFASLRVDYSSRPHIQIDNSKENCRRSPLESFAPFQTSERKSPTTNERVKRLTIEASVQRSLVAQTSKALYLCRTAKQFKESQELVEGERILLLASLRIQAAVEEIKKCGQPPPKSASRGSLTVSDIFVPLKWDIYPKLDRSLCPQWFVCVLTLGETVQATEVVQLVDNQAILTFPGSMHLSDLSCDFRARLQLYAFRTPQHSQKQKSRIVRACKMLRRPTRNCLGPAGSTEELMYIRNPAFKMIGCTELTVGLINQQQPVSCSLEQVPMVSLIKGTINFRLSAQLLNTREHGGFLNVLRPAGQGNAWQRWWCHLDGKVLRCWNYPSDQEDKEAVFSLDLLDCLSEKVAAAPRVLCSRPRTLMLESQRCRGPHDLDSTLLACSPDSTIVRHFLSCDSGADMTEWAAAINECLEALRLWNIVPEMVHELPA